MIIDDIEDDDSNEPQSVPSPQGDGDTGLDPELNKELGEKALEKLRTMVKGNGLKPENMTLEKCECELLEFEALNHFKIEPSISEKHTTGKEHGETCGSAGDVRQRIENDVETLTHDKEIQKYTLQELQKRPDLGFCVQGQVIPLGKHKKRYVVHDSCHICRGDGRVECRQCHGKGRDMCNRCHGDRFMQCTQCNGTRMMNTANGQERCTHCRGEGRIPCRFCNQSGQQQCQFCKSTGQMSCHECNQTGWRSHVFTLGVKAVNRFEYDKESLPEEAIEIIDDLGPEIVTDKHGDVQLIEDREAQKTLDKQSEHSEYLVSYDAKIPWGDITFMMKNTPLDGKIFGYQPEILYLPPFMEKLCFKGIKMMEDAANAPVNVASVIGNAARYRAIRESIIAAARFSYAKGVKFMVQKYPFGFKSGTLENMVGHADRALKRITKKPRQIGLMIGLAIVALFYTLYYLGPIRGFVNPHLPAGNAEMLVDLVLLLIGGTITTMAVQMTAKKALYDAIGRLMPPKHRKSLTPKAGESAIYGYLGGLIIYFIIVELTIHLGMDTPDWFLNLTGRPDS